MVIAMIDIATFGAALLGGALVLGLMYFVLTADTNRTTETPAPGNAPSDSAQEQARHRFVEERGTELIERRVDLDSRRGTLGSFTNIDEALTHLEQELHRGAISPQQFEVEKVRLLTQGTS